MDRIFPLTLALALAIGPACAEDASDTAAVTPASQVEEAKDGAQEKRMICTRERSTGSNRTKRVCRDAAAVEEVGEASREAWSRVQQERYMPPPEGGNR